MGGLIRCAGVLALLSWGCTQITSSTKSAAVSTPPPPGLHAIRVLGRCLRFAGETPDAGATLQIWDCNDSLSQLFEITDSGEIRSADHHWCVSVVSAPGCGGTTPQLELRQCAPSGNQRFTFTSSDIRTTDGSRCLSAVSNDGFWNGSQVVLAACSGAEWQQFTLMASPPMFTDGNATVISELPFTGFAAGAPHTITIADVSAGGSPVVHVLFGGTPWIQAAMGSGTAARVNFSPSPNLSYLVVVRAASNTTAGTCTLAVDGQPWQRNVAFGGMFATLENVRSKETINTVHLPHGQAHAHVFYVVDPQTGAIQGRMQGGGIAGGVSFSAGLLEIVARRFPGPLAFAVGSLKSPGPARVLLNDATMHDLDQDGLGTELEAQLGTCDALTQVATLGETTFDCSLASDVRDTDGDGLADPWEVLGRHHDKGDSPLPMWGADPRHKDMFMEMDFEQHCLDKVQPAPDMPCASPEPDLKMPRDAAREFAQIYGDEMTWTSDDLRKVHAAVLRNPDGKAGISTHLDTGLDPSPGPGFESRDWVRFGDWGGHNLISFRTPFDWKSHISEARLGVFRYGDGYSSCSGATGLGYWCGAPYAQQCGGVAAAHECGHANGLTHEGVGGTGGNCKPQYVSIMNYAYSSQHGIGFSDLGNLGPASLNNTRLTEYRPGYSQQFLTLLQSPVGHGFNYWVRDDGSVDWNRDGEIAPEGTFVRAYSNSTETTGPGCEYTRTNKIGITWSVPPAAAETDKSVAITRLGGVVYLLQEVGGRVGYMSTPALNCEKPSPTPCATLSAERQITDVTGIKAFDVLRLPSDATKALLVYRQGSQLSQRVLTAAGGVLTGSPPAAIPGNDATNQPSLAAVGGTLYLAYRGADGMLHQNSTTGTQFGAPVATTIALSALTSPSLVAASLDGPGTQPKLHGVFARTFTTDWGFYTLYTWDGTTWKKTTMDLGVGYGKPALAWMPPRDDAHLPPEFPVHGRLYVIVADQATASLARMYSNKHTDTGALNLIGQREPFDNVWSRGIGMAMMFEAGVDTNVRAAQVWPASAGNGATDFRPVADGIADEDQSPGSDWPPLRLNVCRMLLREAPRGEFDPPIVCP